MRWYVVADLWDVIQDSSNPNSQTSVHDIAWSPQLSTRPFDTIAAATSQGLVLLRLSSPPVAPSVLAAPTTLLTVSKIPVQGQAAKAEVRSAAPCLISAACMMATPSPALEGLTASHLEKCPCGGMGRSSLSRSALPASGCRRAKCPGTGRERCLRSPHLVAK